ncbi:armadillo-type protein [Polychytrium aggregatum]|uniref:armadillo-type protein n=1 Tax=Polychytrium aggregatum TaxID=110093 RepID=UPI0022FE93B5|nr:armadillo-type protein [Polychytrium aggregatum]KAI9202172.1 armadillo-type protein [Polychytrium aggregatum]
MSWQPQQTGLHELAELLKKANAPSTQVIKHIDQQLTHFHNTIPDFNNYLAYLFAFVPEAEASTRLSAGINLKNALMKSFDTVPAPIMDYCKNCALVALSDSEGVIRNIAGIIISNLFTRDPTKWPELLPKLLSLLDDPNVKTVEGTFGCLEKICEDSCHALSNEGHALSVMMPKFVQHIDNPDARVRRHAIACVNQFILLSSDPFLAVLEDFINALYRHANDTDPDVRRFICQAFVMILEVKPVALLPQIENIVSFMLFCTQDADEQVALESCEFWLAFAEQESLLEYLRPFLPRIVPVLLKGMVYSEEDLIILTNQDEDDADKADEDKDIKPINYRSHIRRQEHVAGAESKADNDGDDDDGDDDDDDEFDDDDDDDEVYAEWNLRKCSAAALDVFATVFEDSLLEHLLPHLKNELFSQDWTHTESGILALGAVAEGCQDGMVAHLPALIPFLLQQLLHPKPLVRAITCWTLGRYSKWVVEIPEGVDPKAHHSAYFVPMLQGLLHMVLDKNKRVQESGCSAFATLEEEAGDYLIPHLDIILQTLTHAFQLYQKKNLLILYDAVGTLADSVGAALSNERYAGVIMQPLIAKWDTINDDDRDIFPLLECLSSVAVALGGSFGPFSPPVWQRCLNIISTNLHRLQLAAHDPSQIEVNKDFIIVSLDLLSGVAQGLNVMVEPLVAQNSQLVITILLHCIKDPVPEVRQSAYALLGDLAISAFGHIKPHLNQFLPELIQQIDPVSDPTRVSVCNNAAWAAGEIALQYQAEMQPWVNELLGRLIPLLNGHTTPKTLLENAAITVGRLGLVCPAMVAPHLAVFIHRWCEALKDIRDNLEKESAFMGLCKMVETNPAGVHERFFDFCEAISLWQRVSPELNDYFGRLLHQFKTNMGDEQWTKFLQSIPPVVASKLQSRYQL